MLLGALAVVQYWVDEHRPVSSQERYSSEINVTNSADRGDGSLREAIFAANNASSRVRIVLRIPQVVLREPLPPIVTPHGVVLEAGPEGASIDATAVKTGPVLEIVADRSLVQGISIAKSRTIGILVKARDVRIQNVRLVECGEALHVLANASGIVVENNSFERNRIGVFLAADVRDGLVRNNRFSGHLDAAVWAVSAVTDIAPDARRIVVTGNRFDQDRTAIIVGNLPTTIEKNDIAASLETGVMVIGRGAELKTNQVHDGAGIGIVLHTAPGSLVEGNEVSRHRTLGVMVRASGGTLVHKNRVYNNGFGITMILGETGNPVIVEENAVVNQQYDGIVSIGDSPVIRRNQIVGNTRAGLSILDFTSRRTGKIRASPFLENNVLSGNGDNNPVRGEYRLPDESSSK